MPAFPEPGLEAGRAALTRFLAGTESLDRMLTEITRLATKTIPGADAASITTVQHGKPETPAFTQRRAIDLDHTQYKIGDGPCLSALRHQGVEHLLTASDDRWPEFNEAATAQGIAAVLSAPLIEGEVGKGALNLYSESGFTEEAPELACLFADQLGIAAVNATLYVEGMLMADQLHHALESRAVIDQAKGILMGAQRCGADAAFDILKNASQHQNRKLRDIAAEIVERYTEADDRCPSP